MSRGRFAARIALILLGAALVTAGLLDGGYRDVLNKAMLICYECMGIG